jgi:ABC-type multidrug transport system ATPase subunit
VFVNTAWSVSFVIFATFSMAMSCLAALVSTLVSTSKTAQTAGYGLILVGFVFQFVIGAGQGALADLLYSSGIAGWVVGVRAVLERYPAYYFTLLFADMASLAGSTVSVSEGRVVTGPGFHWRDMYATRTRQVASFDCTLPAPIELVGLGLVNAVAFALLALYLDAVLPGVHGPAAHPLFCCGWRHSAGALPAAAGEETEAEDAGVREEAAFVRAPPASGTPGEDDPAVVRIVGLRVVYRTLCSRWCRRGTAGDVQAVAGLSLSVRRGEVLALLGHNGCGKSSTIGVLTGLHEAAAGSATVCGADVTAVDRVQELIGVCPQGNLHFAALTALETLQLYCAVKGVPHGEREGEVARVLRQVRLAPVARTVRVGAYSGGMKRRLAVAVAALGRPPVVVLDEPTTGMDPLSRQACWRLIHRLKQDASVLLTTHDMAEANALGSRVAIMAGGKLCALGTPLRLKRQYGQGCRLSVVLSAAPDALSRVRVGLSARLPGARLALLDGCNAVFTVPWDDVATGMAGACDWLDGSSGAAAPVASYSVSAPTLESVYLTVTAAHNFQVLSADDVDPPAPPAVDAVDAVDEPLAPAAPKLPSGTGSLQQPPVKRGGHGAADAAAVAGAAAAPQRRRVASSASMYRALCVKTALVIVRQRGLCACQIITPLLMLCILVLLNAIIKIEAGGSTSSQLVPALVLPLGMNTWYASTASIPINPSWLHPSGHVDSDDDGGGPAVGDAAETWPSAAPGARDVMALLHQRSLRAVTAQQSPPALSRLVRSALVRRGLGAAADVVDAVAQEAGWWQPAPSPSPPPPPPPRPHYPPGYDTDCVIFLLATTAEPAPGVDAAALAAAVGRSDRVALPPPGPSPLPRPREVNVNASGLLGAVATTWCALKNETLVSAPFWSPRAATSDQLDDELMAQLRSLNDVSAELLDDQPPCWPGGGGGVYDPVAEAASCPAYLLPDATVSFHAVSNGTAGAAGGGVTLSYTFQVRRRGRSCAHRCAPAECAGHAFQLDRHAPLSASASRSFQQARHAPWSAGRALPYARPRTVERAPCLSARPPTRRAGWWHTPPPAPPPLAPRSGR